MTDDSPWRGGVNLIRYGIQFDRVLDGSVVDRTAHQIISGRTYAAEPESLVEALHSMMVFGSPTGGLLPIPHSEDDFAAFVEAVHRRVEELRPWPQPPFLKLPPSQWSAFATAQVIAMLHRSWSGIEDFIGESFDVLEGREDGPKVLILRLPSGETVALLYSGHMRDRTVSLLQNRPVDPAQTAAAFQAATNLPAEWIVPVTSVESGSTE